jgi:hypothetical protein
MKIFMVDRFVRAEAKVKKNEIPKNFSSACESATNQAYWLQVPQIRCKCSVIAADVADQLQTPHFRCKWRRYAIFLQIRCKQGVYAVKSAISNELTLKIA